MAYGRGTGEHSDFDLEGANEPIFGSETRKVKDYALYARHSIDDLLYVLGEFGKTFRQDTGVSITSTETAKQRLREAISLCRTIEGAGENAPQEGSERAEEGK
tara:strand:+ start:184 stop:492 length:309 start_codon:yes stop_codon:yes gene_type:complete